MIGYLLTKKDKFYSVILSHKFHSYWSPNRQSALIITCEDELNDIIEQDPLIFNDKNTEEIKINTIELDNISFFHEILNNTIA